MKTVKIAVVGCGHWGKNLARNFAELGALKVQCVARSLWLHEPSLGCRHRELDNH